MGTGTVTVIGRVTGVAYGACMGREGCDLHIVAALQPSPTDDLPSALIKIMKLSPEAITPTTCGTGIELYSGNTYSIPSCKSAILKTGIRMELPVDLVGRIFPIPNLVLMEYFDIFPTVVPHNYRGNIEVVGHNITDHTVTINKGDKVAQMIIQTVYIPHIIEVPYIDAPL